jgi:hypothetical protein
LQTSSCPLVLSISIDDSEAHHGNSTYKTTAASFRRETQVP